LEDIAMTKEEEDMIAEMSGEEFDEYQKTGKKPARFETQKPVSVESGVTEVKKTSAETGGPFARRNEELKKLKKHFGD
jgi:hypothetical protein